MLILFKIYDICYISLMTRHDNRTMLINTEGLF